MKRLLSALLFAVILTACQPADSPAQAEAEPAEPAASETAQACVLKPPAEPFACTMEYDPVCGCDGKTYGNACMAKGAGVPETTPGACEETGAD